MDGEARSNLLLYSVIGFFVGVGLFISGFSSMRMKRIIENLPTSKIRSIAMGLVELKGKCIPQQGKLFRSPFSNQDCVYYRYIIQEHRRSGKSSYWATIKSGEERNHFYLRDDTGTVLVDPDKAKLNVSRSFYFQTGIGKSEPAKVKDFLKQVTLLNNGFLGIRPTRRYEEYIVVPKQDLYIIGTAADNPFFEDGNAKNSTDDIMIQSGKNEKLYYITDKSEKELLTSFGRLSFFGVFGGGALILAGIAIFFGVLGAL